MQPKVLIVEDEMIIALELSKSLKSLGYDVPAIINDGSQALDSIDEFEPDVILMDINIPGEFDGVETGEIINKVYDIPIIFCTAYGEEEVRKRIINCKNAQYLLKPYDDDVLKDTLNQVLSY